jgi:hypothetical protein
MSPGTLEGRMTPYQAWRSQWDDHGPWRVAPDEIQLLLDEIDRLSHTYVDAYDPDDREPMGGDRWWKDEPEW